jgi:hypothetical protein
MQTFYQKTAENGQNTENSSTKIKAEIRKEAAPWSGFKDTTISASFLEHAIVRTSSVCPSVDATTFHGVSRLGRFMARSIAYDPRTRTTEGIFFLTGPGPGGRGLKSKFRKFSYKN